jgi:glycerol uptake facilitator-like aquaporin
MKKTAGKIISFFLVLSLLASGMSLVPKGDVTQDGDVDLADVIVSVRQVARVATDEAALNVGMKNAIVSLSIVAGLKRFLKTDGKAVSPSRDLGNPMPALLADHRQELLPAAAAVSAGRSFMYLSPVLTPPTPPPVSA